MPSVLNGRHLEGFMIKLGLGRDVARKNWGVWDIGVFSIEFGCIFRCIFRLLSPRNYANIPAVGSILILRSSNHVAIVTVVVVSDC